MTDCPNGGVFAVCGNYRGCCIVEASGSRLPTRDGTQSRLCHFRSKYQVQLVNPYKSCYIDRIADSMDHQLYDPNTFVTGFSIIAHGIQE